MKFGKKTIGMAVGIMAICMLIPSCAEVHHVSDSDGEVLSKRTSVDNEIIPVHHMGHMGTAEGSYSGPEYQYNVYLNKNNGKTVNFWIRSKGSVNVVVSINGENERTIKSGKSGHITADVTDTNQSFYFNAKSSASTPGHISIDFRIAQH
ncbi:hypothetical protein [Filifactor alocis]